MKRTRRTFSADFKAKVAIEAIKEIQTVSELAQQYGVHPNLISKWKTEFLANASKAFDSGKEELEKIEHLEKEKQILIHQIGELTVDINWLKKKVL